MPQLLSLLRISDPHIGRIDPISGNATVSQSDGVLFANLSWFDRVQGHHARGLQDLNDLYWQMVLNGSILAEPHELDHAGKRRPHPASRLRNFGVGGVRASSTAQYRSDRRHAPSHCR